MPYHSVRFSTLLLQDDAVGRLRRSIDLQRLSQTYLFTGRKSVGKARLAKAFAAALQCLEPAISRETDNAGGVPTREACGKCLSCRRIEAGTHPDVTFITPQGSDIRIEQIRQMQDMAFLNPYMGKWRVFVIDPADRLNEFSANSLLKILEESPTKALFILLSESPRHVLPTILSRSIVLPLRSPAHEEARTVLSRHTGRSMAETRVFYSLAEGLLGVTLRWLREKEAPLGPAVQIAASGHAGTSDLFDGPGDDSVSAADASDEFSDFPDEDDEEQGEDDNDTDFGPDPFLATPSRPTGISTTVAAATVAASPDSAATGISAQPAGSSPAAAPGPTAVSLLPELDLGAAQVAFLESLQNLGERLAEHVSRADSVEQAQRLLADTSCFQNLAHLHARKALIWHLLIAPRLPAAFPLLFSKVFLDTIDTVKKDLKKATDTVMDTFGKQYPTALARETKDQFTAQTSEIAHHLLLGFLETLLNVLDDARAYSFHRNETLLLNIDRKEDIMAVAERSGLPRLLDRIEQVSRSIEQVRHNVNVVLICENLFSMFGGMIP
jgi:DNA polymerase III delta' subunit